MAPLDSTSRSVSNYSYFYQAVTLIKEAPKAILSLAKKIALWIYSHLIPSFLQHRTLSPDQASSTTPPSQELSVPGLHQLPDAQIQPPSDEPKDPEGSDDSDLDDASFDLSIDTTGQLNGSRPPSSCSFDVGDDSPRSYHPDPTQLLPRADSCSPFDTLEDTLPPPYMDDGESNV